MSSDRIINLLSASLVCCICSTVFSQGILLIGTVRDRNTHRDIPEVNIYVKGTQFGTSSDYAGRFTLRIPEPYQKMKIVFQHIAYEPREILVDSVMTMRHVYLQPRIIPLQEIEIEEKGLKELEIDKDLPQTLSLIEVRDFEIRGYVDAGDLLRTDHSVQIDEELSGRKTATVRGGNPDEVIVLFNGVKLNNSFDNIFDLSLIDLEDIERFEIIKGSNTALYGPEAFSGVINIVPKMQQDYNIRFQQRIGTYRSGNWGVHLHKKFDRILGSYSVKRGGFSRNFVDIPEEQGKLKNSSIHHTANINYNLFHDANGKPNSSLSAMWIYTSLDYDNQRDFETLSNFNNLFSLKYSGQIIKLKEMEFSVSYRKLEEEQNFSGDIVSLNRAIDDRAFHFNVQKSLKIKDLDLLLSYQLQQSELDFLDERKNIQEVQIGLESADLKRTHHGFVAIAKYHGDTDSDFLQKIDLDLSFRHDRLNDDQSNSMLRNETGLEAEDNLAGFFDKNDWQESLFKFAINFSGYRQDLSFNGYLTFGSNTKFPTLFQQISSPLLLSGPVTQPNLNPEKNKSLELGAKVTRDISGERSIYGWQISGNFFQNHYDNKFRQFTTPGIPVTFYDNVQNAQISGFETKSSVFLFRKKLTIDLGISKYFISDKAAFPFKSDLKRTFNFIVDHAGYSFQLHWFKESEQTGWLRFPNGEFAEILLPDRTNIDLHISKTFEIRKLKLFANVSGRNLLNDDDVVLQGLALRDRRYYLTIGAQY